jgi:hypothetical protein
VHISQLSGDALGGVAVLEDLGECCLGAEVLEGEGQHPHPGLSAQPFAVVRQPEPRRGAHLTHDGKGLRAKCDDTEGTVCEEDPQAETPPVNMPGAEFAPVLLENEAGPILGTAFCPWREERPFAGLMNSLSSQSREVGNLSLARESKTKPRCLDRESKQGPYVIEHAGEPLTLSGIDAI